MLHYGHISFLKKCREIAGDDLIYLALNTDEFIERFKGKKPVMNYEERKRVIEELDIVDLIVPNVGEEDSKKTINDLEKTEIPVQMVVIGSDWHAKDYLKQMGFTWEWLRTKDICLCYVPYTLGISTTELKRRLNEK